jgi:hypothetical protein
VNGLTGRLFRRRAPQWSPEQVLAARPLRLVEWTRDDEGLITLNITRRDDLKTRLLSVLFPIPKKRRISLDDLGSEVWELCDGETSLEGMTRAIAKKHKLSLKEAQQPLMKFLNDLAARGFIGFQVQSEESENSGDPHASSHRGSDRKNR